MLAVKNLSRVTPSVYRTNDPVAQILARIASLERRLGMHHAGKVVKDRTIGGRGVNIVHIAHHVEAN